MQRKFQLTEKERLFLHAFKRTSNHSLREFNRATILSFLDKGLKMAQIGALLEVDRSTVRDTRDKYFAAGIEAALKERERTGAPKMYTDSHEAVLMEIFCGPLPEGKKKWTIRLLVSELKKQEGFETVTFATVRKMLKRTGLTLGYGSVSSTARETVGIDIMSANTSHGQTNYLHG